MMKLIKYLHQAGPTHPKHGGGVVRLLVAPLDYPIHPLLSFVIHYSIAITVTFLLHDIFFIPTSTLPPEETSDLIIVRQMRVSRFSFLYTFILFTTRCVSSFNAGRLRQHAVMYELTWCCNSTLLMGCIAFGAFDDNDDKDNYFFFTWLFRRRPLIATACCIGVSIDQVLWYVDLIGYLLSGKFPVGVMRYLTWSQTLWIDRLTCTHHLWTIPMFIYAYNNELGLDSFMLSVCIVTIKVCLSRWLTPHSIQVIKREDTDGIGQETTLEEEETENDSNDPLRFRYLNVNLCHELWKDISEFHGFLQISQDKPPGWLYLWRLLWRWQLLNYLVFVGILSPLSRIGL